MSSEFHTHLIIISQYQDCFKKTTRQFKNAFIFRAITNHLRSIFKCPNMLCDHDYIMDIALQAYAKHKSDLIDESHFDAMHSTKTLNVQRVFKLPSTCFNKGIRGNSVLKLSHSGLLSNTTNRFYRQPQPFNSPWPHMVTRQCITKKVSTNDSHHWVSSVSWIKQDPTRESANFMAVRGSDGNRRERAFRVALCTLKDKNGREPLPLPYAIQAQKLVATSSKAMVCHTHWTKNGSRSTITCQQLENKQVRFIIQD